MVGRTADVHMMSAHVIEEINNVATRFSDNVTAEWIAKTRRWEYKDVDGQWKNFDLKVNTVRYAQLID